MVRVGPRFVRVRVMVRMVRGDGDGEGSGRAPVWSPGARRS